MVKNLLIAISFLMLFQVFAEGAQRVVAVQSIRIKPYNEALKGFRSICDCTIKEIVPSDDPDLLREIHEVRPDLVLAVGMAALSRVKGLEGLPVLYVMVLNPQSIIPDGGNITGVSMNIPPERQLEAVLKVSPKIKRVGLVFDPQKTAYIVKEARRAAGSLGVTLRAEEVHNSRDVPLLIQGMKGKIDALWMLPDTTVITPETVEFLLLYSLENKIPILAFSEKYVEMGALLSVSIDAFDLGRQAGEMARKILSGADIRNMHRADARRAVLSINLKVAEKLGITVSKEIVNKARIVNRGERK